MKVRVIGVVKDGQLIPTPSLADLFPKRDEETDRKRDEFLDRFSNEGEASDES